jgi:hypothetical protein
MARSALASASLHILPVRIAALLAESVLLNVPAVELHAMPCMHAIMHIPFLPSQFAFQISALKAPPHPQRANTISSRRASMMMLCIDLDKVSEKDSRLRVPWSLAPKYDRRSWNWTAPNLLNPPKTKTPRLFELVVHAFTELSPTMW